MIRKTIQFTHLTTSVMITASLLSSCITPKVYRLGATERRIEAEKCRIASNGSIAVEATLVQKGGRFRRYLYRDAGSLRWALRKAPDQDGVVLLHGNIRTTGSSGWQMIPADTAARDATTNDLPVQFSSNAVVYPLDKLVPYQVDGTRIYIRFRNFSGLKSERAAWSYPCQLLLVPAAGIDLALVAATLPFILFALPFLQLGSTKDSI